MTARAVLLTLLGILGLGLAIQCPKQKTSPGREIVCYTSANDIANLSESICRCTTLVHQGHDARNLSISDFEDFRKSLKEVNPPMQFVLQVDDPAKTIKSSAAIRRETTARLVRLLKEVDGVELNVTAGTKDRLFQFVKGVRDEMVKKSLDKRLFLALPTRAETLAKQFNLKDLTKYVDLFTVATHYLVDEDEAYNTFHPSRLMGLFDMINTDSLIDLISGLGAPKRKILVSVPASAYKFTLKDQNENAPRSPTNEKEPVIIDRKQLCDSMNEGEWTIERDEDLTAPYAFKNKTWVAFEDQISVGIKGKYALLRQLPGLAVHNVENDYKTNCGKPVTHEIYHSFTDFKRKSRAAVLNALEDDLHQSQITYPNQVKSSNFRVVRVVDTEGHIRVVRENTQTEFTCSMQGYFVHPRSCNRFYRCVKFNQEVEDYSVFEFDCPAGLAFDERTEVCVWPGSLPEGSPCPGSSEIAPVARVRFECPSQPGYYPDPINARWFFACIDLGGPELMAYEFRCPYGLVFDGEKLVCEWPWLVRGYSGTEHTKTEYDYRGYGASSSSQGAGGHGSTASSQGTGGYVTGGIPHGFYPADTNAGSGGYDQHSGVGIAGGHGGSGFSGAAGVGHGSTSGQGSSFGHDYSETGSTGFTGTTVQSHAGSDASLYTGHGYAGSNGQGYDGSYSGSSGTQYSGSGGRGYSGTAGTQYSGSAGHDFSGTTGTQYSGSAGHDYSGTTGTQYSGSAGHDLPGATGTQYSGSAGHDHSGTTGTQYSGSAGHDYSGTTGTQYSGSAGHDLPGATGTQYSGSAGHDHSGTTGTQYSGSAGHDYSGMTGTQYSGSAGHDYSGTTGTQYSGSAGHDYSGTTGTQYSGSAGHDYSGTTGTQYSGSADHDLSGATGTQYSGSAGHDHTGTTGTQYSGSAGHDLSGATGTQYSGSAGHDHTGTTGTQYSGSAGHDYSGTTGTQYSGSAGHDFPGATGTQYSGPAGHDHTGTTGTQYSGSAGHDYSGTAGTQYSGSAGHGYSGTTAAGSYGSNGFDYSQSTDTKTGSGISTSDSGSYSGSNVYSGSTGGSHGVSGTIDYSGSPGPGYAGVGSAGTDYSDISGAGNTGSFEHGSVYGESQGTKYSGSTTTAHDGSYGTIYSQAGAAGSSSTSGHFAGGFSNGGGYAGATDTGSSQHGYSGSSGTTGLSAGVDNSGSGYPGSRTNYVGSVGVSDTHAQTPTVTLVGHGQGIPSVTYLPSTPSASGHGFPGQSDVTTTYFEGASGADGYSIKGSNIGGGKTTIAGSTIYHGAGGIGTSYGGPVAGSNVNITLLGQRPIGNIPYHGYDIGQGVVGTGTIVSGNTIQGSIITDDSSSGTVFTHGDGSGTVFTGSSDQGSIVTGSSYPGYANTGAGTPGYVISGGVKTIYPGSAGPGTFIHGSVSPGITLKGPSVPGTVLKGDASPGIVLTGQTAPGVLLGGSVEQGTIVGVTASHHFTDTGYTSYQSSAGGSRTDSTSYTGPTRIGTIPPSPNTGYKTNEYHDNGGRGTIKFNNGFVTTKYTENDIPDYRPAGPTITDSVLTGGVISSSAGVTGSPISTQTPGYSTQRPLTPSGFTKTGPTKTGITTATLGGRGSYVISNGQPKPIPNPEHIGAKAFEGNVAGYTRTSTESSSGDRSYSTSTTQSQDTSYVDTSKITLGPSVSKGYSYPKPSVPFVTGVASSTPSPISSTDAGGIIGVTTPTPFLNVEVYNNPSMVHEGSITASPDIGNTYNYNQPSVNQYQGNTGQVSIEYGSRRPFTPTATPVGFTTGPLENFKTTVFEAAKIPVTISTVQPVIDTGYKTVVSPTVIPVTLTVDQYGTKTRGGSVSSHGQSNVGIGTSYQQSGYGDRNDYISVTSPPAIPTVSYQQPEIYVQSTTPANTGFSYGTVKPSYGEVVAPSGGAGSDKPQTQYLPPSSISPAVGVTYRKPFAVAGITYQQSTPPPGVVKIQGFTGSSDSSFSSFYSKSDYSSDAKTTIESGSRSGGSPTNLDISRDEVGKLITNYDRGAVKYTPSLYDTYGGADISDRTLISSSDFSSKHSSQSSEYSGYPSSTPGLYGKTPPPVAVTKYTGTYSRPTSKTASYEVTTKPSTAVGKAKVIVKWSDLHPLLLGKLGAECTCRADPFGNLRGPGSKVVSSSRGQVDLANYDESEIYVDLEKEGSYEDGDYVTNYGPVQRGPIKVLNTQAPIIVADSIPLDNGPQFGNKPSSSYLPSIVPSTASPVTTPCSNGRDYELRGSVSGPTKIGSVSANTYIPSEQGLVSGQRTGKTLNTAGASVNSVGKAGAAFDRYGPGGLRGYDETLEGGADCARPGLFRHPNYCNKFYACHWDQWKKRFTLHVFNCPVHLTFDSGAGACNWPSKGPACQDDNLLV